LVTLLGFLCDGEIYPKEHIPCHLMKVALINLTGGGMSGGYRKYLLAMLPRLATHHKISSILCASPPDWNMSRWFEKSIPVRFINCSPFRVLNYKLTENLYPELIKFKPDVLFIPVERIIEFRNTPVINMLGNMEPYVKHVRGTPLEETIRNKIRFWEGVKALKKANRVIATSGFVRDYMIEKLGLSKEKVGFVYQGFDLNRYMKPKKPIIIPEEWEGKFIFTAGSVRPARGLEDIIFAMQPLLNKLSTLSGLVIAGHCLPLMQAYKSKLIKWLNSHQLTGRVLWSDFLSEEEMAWCYKNCKVFVMTSRVESFGHIAIEAMSHGCVCISSTCPCLPEIFDEAAMYYSPGDWKNLSESIIKTCREDRDYFDKASERAKHRASQFSWDITAEKTVQEIQTALEC